MRQQEQGGMQLGQELQELQDASQGSCTALNGEEGFAHWGVTRAKHINRDDYTQASHKLRERNDRYGSCQFCAIFPYKISISGEAMDAAAAALCIGALCSLGKSYIL